MHLNFPQNDCEMLQFKIGINPKKLQTFSEGNWRKRKFYRDLPCFVPGARETTISYHRKTFSLSTLLKMSFGGIF